MSGETLERCDICGREVVVYERRRAWSPILCAGCVMEGAERPSPGLAPQRPVGCPSCAQAEAEVDRLKAALDLEARARKAAADGLADAKERLDAIEAAAMNGCEPQPGIETLWHEGAEVVTLASASKVIRWGRRGWEVGAALQAERKKLREGLVEMPTGVFSGVMGVVHAHGISTHPASASSAGLARDGLGGVHEGNDTFEEWRGER